MVDAGTVDAPNPGFHPTVPVLIRRFSAAFGEAEAIVGNGSRITFAGLATQSSAVAKSLISIGAGKGVRVGVLAPPGPEFVVAVLAASRIGAVAVPLSTLYQAPELAWVIVNAEIQHLIVADSYLRHDYLSRLEEALPGLAATSKQPLFLELAPRLRTIHVIGRGSRPWSLPYQSLLRATEHVTDAMLEAVEDKVCPADPVCTIYTSGSTADPKGVIHGHGPLVRHSWQLGTEFCPFALGDRVITTRALFWVAGFVATLFYALQNGTCLIATSDPSPEAVLRLVHDERATGLCGDAGWFEVLRDSPEFGRDGLDVVRLNLDNAGLARGARFVSDQIHERVGPPVHSSAARIAHSFGMTETLGAHTSLKFGELLPENRPRWQGRPVPGVEAQVVDPVTRQPLRQGEMGELRVRGYCLMLGLDGRERQETFDADGYYATGDLCTIDEQGLVKFESRIGEMIKVHGANVAPLEVELALVGLGGIEMAAVVGIPGESGDLLVAGVVMAPGRILDETSVRQALKSKLSSFKIPSRIIAFEMSAMPATGSGKVRKNLLIPALIERLATA